MNPGDGPVTVTFSGGSIDNGTYTSNDNVTSGSWSSVEEFISTNFYLVDIDGNYIVDIEGNKIIIGGGAGALTVGDLPVSLTYTVGDVI